LRGDLDTILLTALRLEPAARYGSAEAFAVRAKTRYRPAWRATTSRLLAPIVPVAPKMARFML